MCTSFNNDVSNIIQYGTQWQNDYCMMAAVMASFEVLLQHLCQGTRKEGRKNLRKDDQCPSQYMNQSLPTYNSEVFSLHLNCQVSMIFENTQFCTGVYVQLATVVGLILKLCDSACVKIPLEFYFFWFYVALSCIWQKMRRKTVTQIFQQESWNILCLDEIQDVQHSRTKCKGFSFWDSHKHKHYNRRPKPCWLLSWYQRKYSLWICSSKQSTKFPHPQSFKNVYNIYIYIYIIGPQLNSWILIHHNMPSHTEMVRGSVLCKCLYSSN
jgi:hypothetical protein